jgi:hypothetical protein
VALYVSVGSGLVAVYLGSSCQRRYQRIYPRHTSIAGVCCTGCRVPFYAPPRSSHDCGRRTLCLLRYVTARQNWRALPLLCRTATAAALAALPYLFATAAFVAGCPLLPAAITIATCVCCRCLFCSTCYRHLSATVPAAVASHAAPLLPFSSIYSHVLLLLRFVRTLLFAGLLGLHVCWLGSAVGRFSYADEHGWFVVLMDMVWCPTLRCIATFALLLQYDLVQRTHLRRCGLVV